MDKKELLKKSNEKFNKNKTKELYNQPNNEMFFQGFDIPKQS
jgi:hypothetical protein